MASLETLWISFASCVVVLRMQSLTVCGETLRTTSNSNAELPPELSCPDPEVITPCECTFNATLGMDMDCSKVKSEDELRRVFSNFSSTDFRKFNITENYNIQSLRVGDLGSSSFTEIYIEHTSLSLIEYGALNGSLHTLVTLQLNFNNLKLVHDISAFTSLKYLRAYKNQIYQFPIESSATLLELNLSDNQIDDVPADAIIEMTSLETLYLYWNSLTEIHPNTFTRNKNLAYLSLGGNKLTSIPDDAVTLHGHYTSLYLYGNQLMSLTYEAVSSVNYRLDLHDNNLTEVSEDVFRPLLEGDVDYVDLYENPFKCGCDVAWLVLNQTLLNRLDLLDYTRCSNGEKFNTLDPEVYKFMCPNATAVPL